MKTLRESIVDFIHSEDLRKNLYTVVQPIYKNLYNEIYPYLWFICIYMVINSQVR